MCFDTMVVKFASEQTGNIKGTDVSKWCEVNIALKKQAAAAGMEL